MFKLTKISLLSLILVTLLAVSASAGTYIAGDLNEDNYVDFNDLEIFCEQWLDPTGYSGSACADLDNFGGIDMVDFAILAQNWQKEVGPVVINEFMADNEIILEELGNGPINPDCNFPDWIELYNPTAEDVNLIGWHLTDSRNNPQKWPFPDIVLQTDDYLIVYPSGRDTYPDDPCNHPYIGPEGNYHCNFQLSANGEYLALVRPDGVIAYEYDENGDGFPPQPNDVSYGLYPDDNSRLVKGYFLDSTPGTANSATGLRNTGPDISNVAHSPASPNDLDDIVVTASVKSLHIPITSITLFYRVMYGSETAIPMVDNGTGADETAFDGVYTAVIPDSASAAGEMIRWYITAAGANGGSSRLPLHSPPMWLAEYFGTVIENPAINTPLPVLHWFAEDPCQVDLYEGGPASVYYQGRFYDNIFVRGRGGTMLESDVPNPSHKFNFNHDKYFILDPDRDEVSEFVLNTNMGEKTYIRQSLAFQFYALVGVPCPDSFLMRVEQNGEFYSLNTYIEQPNEEMLERNGLDGEGAFYKMYNFDNNWIPRPNRDDRTGSDKETREYDDRNDLKTLVENINFDSPDRRSYFFDNINFPEVINYLAATMLMMDRDCRAKNHFLYRDSDGNGEWYVLPWDKDYSWGRNYGGGDATLWQDDVTYSGNIIDSWNALVTNDPNFSNRFAAAIYDNEPFRQMYLRRLYTLMEEMLKPPGTPAEELFFENHVDDLLVYAQDDAHLDYLKWGNPWVRPLWAISGLWFPTQEMPEAIDILKTQYFAPRRDYLFNNSHFTGIPSPVPPNITFGTIEHSPTSGNQAEEYIEIINNTGYAVDISGWKLTGGIEHTFQGGTVLSSLADGDRLYVSPDVVAFRARTTSPKAGENRFVQGNYKGHLSSWGETINLYDSNDALQATVTYTGTPSDTQQYLRITELMYHPADPCQSSPYNDEDYEYVELKNIGPNTIYLDNVGLTDAIDYRFPAGSGGSPVTTINDVTLIDYEDSWKYEPSGSDLGTQWREVGYNDNPWPDGDQLIYEESGALPAPWVKNTQIDPYDEMIRTYYFRTTFDLNFDPAVSDISLEINCLIDDGAAIYINGSEAQRIRIPSGPIDYTTAADYPSTPDALNEVYSLPSTALVQGQNLIAVEVHQAGSSGSSDMVMGIKLDAHIETTTFPQGSSDTALDPGQYVLVVKDPNAFVERYPDVNEQKIFGPYTGYLANSEERLKLEDDANNTILDFTYKDSWYLTTDGYGFSLTILNPDDPNLESWNEKLAWRPSTFADGSPGQDDQIQSLAPGSIVINEVLSHSHLTAPDWIELYNTTDTAIEISGWFLSDDDANVAKYEIAATVIGAYGYEVFYEDTTFNDPNDSGCLIPFALSENGEIVCLSAAIGGELTGYSETEDFGASETDVSFGRYYKVSTDNYNFVAMSAKTPGAANAYPKVGPIVINEIMYDPISGNQYAEYIELYNASQVTVSLQEYDADLGVNIPWAFTDGIEFVFPLNTTLTSGEYLLVVKDTATFLATHPTVPSNVQILQWGGDTNLSNGGEKLELSMPGDLDDGERCYIRIDRINYSDGSHPENCPGGIDLWPTGADGNGDSLSRINPADYGNDVANWDAKLPSPGLVN